MLKGTLEGIVLAVLSGRPAYGYEITAWLREKGFSDIAEGTVYALLIRIEKRGLVDVEKVPSEKGPPRKVYSLNADGETTSTSSGGRGASSQSGWNSSAKEAGSGGQSLRDRSEEAWRASTRHAPNSPCGLPHGSRGFERYMNISACWTATTPVDCSTTSLISSSGRSGGTPVREIVGKDPVEFAEAFVRNYPAGQWIVRERDRLTSAIDRADAEGTGNVGVSR